MGYQWISRFLANDLVCCDTVMEPFAREVLTRRAETGDPVPLILDQTKASDRHQILMLSVRWPFDKLRRARLAAGLAGRGERGRHRFRHAKRAARSGRRLGLPADQNVILLADRFYGTPEMIRWCRDRGWDYRLRLKSNLLARRGASRTTTGALALLSLSKGRRPLFRGCRPHRQTRHHQHRHPARSRPSRPPDPGHGSRPLLGGPDRHVGSSQQPQSPPKKTTGPSACKTRTRKALLVHARPPARHQAPPRMPPAPEALGMPDKLMDAQGNRRSGALFCRCRSCLAGGSGPTQPHGEGSDEDQRSHDPRCRGRQAR